jgi:hypothetical protein
MLTTEAESKSLLNVYRKRKHPPWLTLPGLGAPFCILQVAVASVDYENGAMLASQPRQETNQTSKPQVQPASAWDPYVHAVCTSHSGQKLNSAPVREKESGTCLRPWHCFLQKCWNFNWMIPILDTFLHIKKLYVFCHFYFMHLELRFYTELLKNIILSQAS